MAEMTERQAPQKLSKWQLFLNHLYFYSFTYQSQSQSRKAGIHLCASMALLAKKLYPGDRFAYSGQTYRICGHEAE